MRVLSQIFLLTWKNLIIWRRSKKWLLLEMALSLLFLPIIIFVVFKSNSEVTDEFSFESVPITGTSADLTRDVKNLSAIWKKWCLRNVTLAYTGNLSVTEEIMRIVEARFDRRLIIEPFENIQKMLDELKRELNVTHDRTCGKYFGGVYFKQVSLDPPRLDYKLYLPQRNEEFWSLKEFWLDEGPYSPSSDVNSIPSRPPYWTTGFLSIQFAIEHTFLKKIGKDDEFDVFLQRFPTPKYRSSDVVTFLKLTPNLWALFLLMIILHTTKNIVAEKEAGIKTYMIVMGLKPMAFYMSHFVIGYIKISFILILCAGMFSFGLAYISANMFIVYTLLFGCCAILFSIFVSTFIRRPSPALSATCFLWTALIGIDLYAGSKISLSQIGICMIFSLNPITAYRLGIKSAATFEARQMELGWLNMFQGADSLFTFGHAFFMLIIDAALFCFIIFYLDSVVPTDDSPRKHPLFFMKLVLQHIYQGACKNALAKRSVDEVDAVDEPDANLESEQHLNIDEADIDIRHMTKTWSSTGQRAVDNLSFRAFRGQISVLLGHNGAGKSTTFSVLSGGTSTTSGDVRICRQSIIDDLSTCQQKLGYCPQYNPLFPMLTVMEHMKLYAKMKGGHNSDAHLRGEINHLLTEVQLIEKAKVRAANLSGGMKRKLCVAISLVNNSPVVLLDEPTAGMDPEARNEIRVLLKRMKKDRTILLTTHYMDEADSLGDRIGIMVKGRLVCNGTPTFLKTRFGTGYVLSFVIDSNRVLSLKAVDKISNENKSSDEADAARFDEKAFEAIKKKIISRIKQYVVTVSDYKTHIPEFSVLIPVDYRDSFVGMFADLEKNSKELGIKSFGLSYNTLEQVFLKVAENAEKTKEQNAADGERIKRYAAELFSPIRTQKALLNLWIQQFCAVLFRGYLNALRNPIRLLFTAFLVLLLTLLIGGFASLFDGGNSSKDLSLMKMETVSIPLQLVNSPKSFDFPFIIGKIPNTRLLSISADSRLDNALLAHTYDSPPLGVGAMAKRNESTDRNTIYALFNGVAFHAPVHALLLVSNAMLKDKPDSIKLNIEIYAAEVTQSTINMIKTFGANIFIAISVILTFSILMSNFVICLVEDRQRRFKHQMLLTKLNPFIYWLANTVWHGAIYSFYCFLIIVIFVVYKWIVGCIPQVAVLLALFFWSCMPLVYCASFFFDSLEYAQNALLIGNVVLSLIIMTLVQLLSSFLPKFFIGILNRLGLIIFPSYALGKGMLIIATSSAMFSSINDLNIDVTLLNQQSKWVLLDKEVVVCMLVSGFFFWFLLVLLESKTVLLKCHKCLTRFRGDKYNLVEVSEDEDEDVAEERRKVNSATNADLTLAVRGIYKYYGDFCAVRNLTFGVHETDCFGLLGVNGAGKTSTFDILTGNLLPTAGTATIDGISIFDSPVIAYCPQFDALPLDLTGRQVLSFLARLNGFEDVVDRVNKVLWSIRMTDEADKCIAYYSGGQKRRISIGVTLISPTRLIMLDEPTAGIDPHTRRHIWDLLLAIRKQQVAMLLTSHSMDECEELCNRIGFMNRGALIGLGTSQHLKSRYGNSYLLTFVITNPNLATFLKLDEVVVREFKARPSHDGPSSTLHWEVPKNVDGIVVTWSEMYKKAKDIADRYKETAHLPPGSELPVIKDYSVTQNSLEQVFLRMATINEPSDKKPRPTAYLPTYDAMTTDSSSSLLHMQSSIITAVANL